jgi:hypothetical protein
VRYLTYQEKGGSAFSERLELGYIGPEFVSERSSWLNVTRNYMDPENVFRRVDF